MENEISSRLFALGLRRLPGESAGANKGDCGSGHPPLVITSPVPYLHPIWRDRKVVADITGLTPGNTVSTFMSSVIVLPVTGVLPVAILTRRISNTARQTRAIGTPAI